MVSLYHLLIYGDDLGMVYGIVLPPVILPWNEQNHKNSELSGWWYTYPSEKYESQDDDIPNIWKVIIHSCSKPPSSLLLTIIFPLLLVYTLFFTTINHHY